MTVRAYCPDTGAIAVVDALGIGGINIDSHLVTANTKLLSIRDVHRPVESTHVSDARDKKEDSDNTCGQLAGFSHCPPVLSEEDLDVAH
jgi:hypothetical protein